MHPNDPDNVWPEGEEDAERNADMDARNEAHAGDPIEDHPDTITPSEWSESPGADTLGSFLKATGFLPFRIVETPDYAEVHAANGDGKTAFALTLSPSFFEELNRIFSV